VKDYTKQDFAAIRTISKRQVLIYNQSDNDAMQVRIVFRLKNGTNIDMNMSFDTEKAMLAAFKKVAGGSMDERIEAQISELEENVKVEAC
jgi:hypothetical protein